MGKSLEETRTLWGLVTAAIVTLITLFVVLPNALMVTQYLRGRINQKQGQNRKANSELEEKLEELVKSPQSLDYQPNIPDFAIQDSLEKTK